MLTTKVGNSITNRIKYIVEYQEQFFSELVKYGTGHNLVIHAAKEHGK